jgi:pimeloyl-ACP methyl ester carboxylesterase
MTTDIANLPAATITLRDGRTLGYAEFGSPLGRPVVFVHGWCGSRLTRHPDDALTAGLGIRLITVDRPGVGLSDRKRGRRLLDWPDDVAQLMDALGVERFGVVGHSAGGPHALACGVRIPDRISALGVVCGFAPMNRPGATQGMTREMRDGVGVLRRLPWLSQLMVRSLPAKYRRDPQAAWEAQFGRNLPPSDRAELEQRPGLRENLLAAAVEAMRGGSAGVGDEVPLFLGLDWGFAPAEVRVPTWFWYGQADVLVPSQMAHFLAASIPGATLTEFPGEGHMVYVSHWEPILRTIGQSL